MISILNEKSDNAKHLIIRNTTKQDTMDECVRLMVYYYVLLYMKGRGYVIEILSPTYSVYVWKPYLILPLHGHNTPDLTRVPHM